MSGYPQCMKSGLKGQLKGLGKAERKKKFCMRAKICSGRASTEAQAASMCK